ncbi:MAG TPA: helix-turn-helix domain-containing protein [Rhizomicrobium sp.]
MSLNISRKEPSPGVAAYPLSDGVPAGIGEGENLQHRLGALREFARTQHFARNEAVFQEGDRAQAICHVVSGAIRLCRHTEDGRRHIAEFALGGDLFGVVGGATQVFTAEAVSDVVLRVYPRVQFDRLSEREPGFRASVLSHLSSNLMSTQMHTFVLGCQSAKERLASFLVGLAARTGALENGRLELSMGRQDIADHLGLTIETICRAVTALKNAGLIAVPTTHRIELRKVDALIGLSGGRAIH